MTRTQLKPMIEAEISGLGNVYRIEVPFDKAVESLESVKASVISARDLAYARITEGTQSSLSKYGSYIQEGDIYIPSQGIFLVRNPLLLQLELAEEAVQAHNNKEYLISEAIADEYKEKASDSPEAEVFCLRNLERIQTNRFGEDKRTLWLFQDKAQEYGEFLKEYKITEMPLWFDSQEHINNQESPYANQLWLHDLGSRSDLNGDDWSLSHDDRVRGVFKNLGEAQTQKIKAYTQEQISSAVKSLGFQGLEKLLFDKLEE